MPWHEATLYSMPPVNEMLRGGAEAVGGIVAHGFCFVVAVGDIVQAHGAVGDGSGALVEICGDEHVFTAAVDEFLPGVAL